MRCLAALNNIDLVAATNAFDRITVNQIVLIYIVVIKFLRMGRLFTYLFKFSLDNAHTYAYYPTYSVLDILHNILYCALFPMR